MSLAGPIAIHRSNALRHAQKRAWERCGLALGPPELERIAAMVRRGDGTMARPAGKCRQAWRVRWQDREIAVVYDALLDCVVTVLPWAGLLNNAPSYGRKRRHG